MKWFKHYENAHTNQFLQALLREKNGLELYARWFLLLEFLCGEFKKDTIIFHASSEQLMAALRIGQRAKVGKVLETFRKLSVKFDESLLKVSETSGNFWKIETPIILELMGKEFKRTRHCRGTAAPKKKEIRNKKKEYIIDEIKISSSESKTLKHNESLPQKSKESTNKPSQAIKHAYFESYKSRYGITPVWSVKENVIANKLIKSVGFNEALELAKRYPFYPDPWHVKHKHPLSLLITSINKVRVELANPNTMHYETDIKNQIDDMQKNISENEWLRRENERALKKELLGETN